MKITGKVATLVLLTVFFLCLCLLLYPSLAQYWNSKVQSKAVFDYEAMMESHRGTDYSAEFEAAAEYNRALAALPAPMTQYGELEGYSELLNVSGIGMMGYIVIDKLTVELPIYHTTSSDVLSIACGHLEGSSLPSGGTGTHAVLSAHRGLPGARLFTDLDRMQIGDTFVLNILGETLTYQVDQIRIVEPSDPSALQIDPERDLCTLLTCTPYGVNSHRLLVRGTRIANLQAKKVFVTSEAYRVDKLVVTPIVALPIVFLFILYVSFKPVKRKVNYEALLEGGSSPRPDKQEKDLREGAADIKSRK